VLHRKALLCSLNLVLKSRPVCPMYAISQSGDVCLWSSECVNMSWECGLCVRWCSSLLLVR
jgi:Fe-S-cluster-containing hydrogenase component 2